ncbi:MAG: PAS domain-containing protein, partial [Campylobacterota bacterium]|nr:PAS domain-containing protein [Campylobacterota bacterium]
LRPVPTGIENKLPTGKLIVSKTDPKGGIVSVSQTFVEISGYKEGELISSAHSLLRHPDMPKSIFKLMWDRLNRGVPTKAIIKNITKCGNHFWAYTSIEVKKDRDSDEIRNFIAYRIPISKDVKGTIEVLYKDLLEVEEQKGMDAAIEYLQGYLDEHRLNYDDFMDKLEEASKDESIFSKIKNIF